jgi:hypothetical protein
MNYSANKESDMLLCKLCELYQDAVSNYKDNGRTDYDAGQVEGIRKAIKVLEDLEGKK